MAKNDNKSTSYLVGRAIAKQRKQSGFNQEQVARAIDKSLTTIKNIETGVTSPTFENLVAIAKVLNVSPGTFFPDYQPPDADPEHEQIISEIFGHAVYLPEEYLRMLRLIARAMTEENERLSQR